MRERARQVLVAIAAVLAMTALAACSGNDDNGADAAPADTTSSTSTTAGHDDDAADALRVWRDYLVVSQEWRDPPDPGHPRIADFIASEALEDFREGIAVELARDTARRPSATGLPEHTTTVRSSTSSSVVLEDCFVDDFVAYNFRTGEVLDDAVATRTLEVELVDEGGGWKIERIREIDKVEGRAECAG
jgi:hypothetical protein